jgi:hypothetical protein
VIDPAQFADWQLYFQNNSSQAGFNPNDEHALRRPFGAGEAVFALRDDLGTPTTSEPFVLIRYRDPASSGQWRMKVWQVVAEEAPVLLPLSRAGRVAHSIALSASQPWRWCRRPPGSPAPTSATGKLFFWAKAAGDDGGPAEIVVRYFYPMQPGFFFASNQPPLGASVPFWIGALAHRDSDQRSLRCTLAEPGAGASRG